MPQHAEHLWQQNQPATVCLATAPRRSKEATDKSYQLFALGSLPRPRKWQDMRFLKWGYPQNHPFIDGFSLKSTIHLASITPMTMETPRTDHVRNDPCLVQMRLRTLWTLWSTFTWFHFRCSCEAGNVQTNSWVANNKAILMNKALASLAMIVYDIIWLMI